MVAEAEKTRKLDFEEIQIPTGPRLGSQVVDVTNLDKGFDGRILIKDLSFTLPRNGIVGVIGPNGVGKTTLFKTIVGLEEPDDGSVKIGETVKLSYVDQNRGGLDPKKNVWQVVSDGLENALEQFPGCAVVISHDRWFLDRTCTHILAWEGTDDDESKWYFFEGNFSDYER